MRYLIFCVHLQNYYKKLIYKTIEIILTAQNIKLIARRTYWNYVLFKTEITIYNFYTVL